AGLAGLVAATEIADGGRRVPLLEREGGQDLGGRAWWSFCGLFLVGTPERRRLCIRDSLALARQVWLGSAAVGAPGGRWPRRAGGRAEGHGSSVPRFHVTWETGPGIVDPFAPKLAAHRETGRITLRTRHAVEELLVEDGRVTGVRGSVLAADDGPRGAGSSREVTGEFEARAAAVLVATGGIGGDEQLVRSLWSEDLGTMPGSFVHGVPASVDGTGMLAAERAGARWIHKDRMWHYTEGIRNWDPVWRGHGIRILPGPSSLWIDARGRRLPAP